MKYKEQGVEVVAIDVTSDVEGAETFFKQRGITIPSLQGDWDMAAALFDVRSTPTNLLIDARGRVMFRHTGFRQTLLPALDAEIQALLSRKP